MKNNSPKNKWDNSKILSFWIVILVIAVIVIFIISLGTINTTEIKAIPNEYKDSKDEAKARHIRLSTHIEKQKNLKERLDRKFKVIYFFIRTGLIKIWVLILLALYFGGYINNLNDILTFSECMVLILLIFNFITFGTLSNLKNYLEIIKIKTENWVYGKYVNLNERIEINVNELTKISLDQSKSS